MPILCTVLFVVLGVPLFLRMPVWCDITLYDMAARTTLRGGVHYRDLFDTNTPGYVWLLAVVRTLAGWSSEAVRAVDLLFFAGLMLVLDRLAKRGGATGLNRLWLLAGGVGFYPFTEEMVHAQRDVWLALPAMLAVSERLKRITSPATAPGVFRGAFVEGLLWAVVVWIKPHFIPVAFTTWVLTIPRLAGGRPRPWRAALTDLAGNLSAGILLGTAGIGYMMCTGTWKHFVDVMTGWNVGYMETTFETLHIRTANWLGWFPPWSFLLPATAGLALFGLYDARVWSARFRRPEDGGLCHAWSFSGVWYKAGTDQERFTRAVVGAVYLAWVAQSLLLQRPFQYAHAIEVLLSLAVWASYRWNVAAFILAWLVAVSMVWAVHPPGLSEWHVRNETTKKVLVTHPLCDPKRVALWPDCFRTGLSEADYRKRQDALRHETFHAASIGWAELHEVAEFLRPLKVGDRELLCWHDSPHPLYLMLDLKPAIRFMHVNTASFIDYDRVLDETAAALPGVRFVVIDLRWYALLASQVEGDIKLYDEPGVVDVLPPRMPQREIDALPFNTLMPVFRSGGGTGRYVVFVLR